MNESVCYQKNLARWERFCPTEAGLLSGVDAIPLVAAADEDPVAEAVQAVGEVGLRETNVVFVYGVGAGHMYEALLGWLRESTTRQLVFLEPDLGVIKNFFNQAAASDILYDPQVWLYYLDPEDSCLEKVTTLFVLQPWQLVVTRRNADNNPRAIHLLKSKLVFQYNLKHMTLFEYMQLGWGYFQNFFRNIALLPEAYLANKLYGRFSGVPAIICGAGPSLKKNLHVLAQLKDRALIFAGGTAMNAINANGFTPHFGVGIDPNPDQFTRLITNSAFETPYFYRNRLQHESLTLIHGDHVYVPGGGGYGVTDWLEKQLGIEGADVSEGCNVVNFSLSIAAAMGCNPIIFVGVDLAYTDEEPYAPGIFTHPIHVRREHFKTKSNEEELILKPDIEGKAVYTIWKWVMESCWFSTFSDQHPQIKMINATEGGLGFTHIPNMPLQKLADEFLTAKYDFSGLVHSEIQRCKMPDNVSKQHLLALMEELASGLERCGGYIAIIMAELERIAKAPSDESSIAKQLLTEKALDAQKSLEADPTYLNFLNVFDGAFTRSVAYDNQRIEIDQDLLGEKKIKELKRDQLAHRYHFLGNTVSANLKHLREAVDDVPCYSEGISTLGKALSSPRFDDGYEAYFASLAVNGLEKKVKKNTNGCKVAEYHIQNGLLQGLFTHFFEDGRPAAKSVFERGLRKGPSVFYYPNGGVAALQYFDNDRQEGQQTYYYTDGTLRAEMAYAQGSLHGLVKLYSRNGHLFRELSFVHGKRAGVERMWNKEGLLYIEAFFKDGVATGKAKKWYGNGNIALEIVYDDEGVATSVRKWDKSGMLIAKEEGDNDDYFDQITKQTGVLTGTLENVVTQVLGAIPALSSSLALEAKGVDFKSFEKDLEVLKSEMDRLKSINRQLIIEGGLDPAIHKEPLWKSPSTRHILEREVEEKANALSQDLSSIQISLAKALQDMLKNNDKPPIT